MIVDRTVLVLTLIFIVAALGGVVAISRRLASRAASAAVMRAPSAFGRFAEILTIAVAFGLATGAIHVLLAIVNRYVRHRFLLVGPQMFWMTPVAYALIFAAVGGLPAVFAAVQPRLRIDRPAITVFAGLGAFSLLLPFPQIHKAAAALIAAGIGTQIGRAMAGRPDWWLSLMRRATVLGAVGVLVVAGVSEAWPIAAERSALSRLPAAPAHAPNVLLIVLDTVRAESLSVYGYGRPTTPGLERLAREGATFDYAMSTAPWTLKSHGSMFTGLYPEEIRGDFEYPLDFATSVLAEEFQRRGYVTGGFAGNLIYASRESGLARGFVHYEDYQLSARQLFMHSWISQTPVLRNILTSRSAGDLWNAVGHPQLEFDANDFNRKTYERKAAASISGAFLDWQSAHEDRPFFAFLNLFDAHFPYRSQREFERQFAMPDNALQGLYDGAIAYIDSEIQGLLDELRRRNILDNTVVVITSDHGEHFGDHGLILHANSLYTQLLHVPLLIRYPPATPGGVRVSTAVTLRDLAATIAQLAGLSGATFPGTSLVSHWTQGTGTAPPAGSVPLAELSNVVRPEPSSPASFGPMRSAFDQQFHYIRRGDGAEELFDYRADPTEKSDLSKTETGKQRMADLRRLGDPLNQLYVRVDQALRALILLLGTWAIYAQIEVLARVPFTTLRLFAFLPLVATAFLLRATARSAEPCDSMTASDQPSQSRWFSSPILRFGGPLAVAAIFFLTKSEWAFWIPAAAVLTAEVWFAPAWAYAGKNRTSTMSVRLEAVVLACLCAIAVCATAGLIRPDNDDAYFVSVATSVNEFPDRPALSFDAMHRDGLPPVEQALHLPQSYEVLVGLVSSVTGAPVPTLYYLFFPVFWTVLGTLAHWLVLRHLLPRRDAILAAAIWVFIMIFWGDGLRAFGSFGFARIFQGKAIFLVVLAPLIVLAALRYRQRPSLSNWICLALSESAATALTTNAIILAPLLTALAIAARPRFDRSYIRALAGGAAASLPVIVMAALLHARLSPFMTPEDPDPFFRPYLTTLGFTRTPLVLLAVMLLPVLAARARLACADWIRSYVWLVLILVFLPVTADLATLALGNTFSWRIFWSVPVPLLVSLAGGIAAGGVFNRRWIPEAAIVGWLVVFAFAAAPTFAQGSWSLHNFGRLKVAETRYSAARATLSIARTGAPALVTEPVAVYMTGMPGGPPLIGVRSLYLRKLRHLIPDAVLARRLELFAYVARGGRGAALADDLEEITRSAGGDPFLPLDAVLKGIDAAGVATVVVREDHPDLAALEASLGTRGFIIHRLSGFVVAALPK